MKYILYTKYVYIYLKIFIDVYICINVFHKYIVFICILEMTFLSYTIDFYNLIFFLLFTSYIFF